MSVVTHDIEATIAALLAQMNKLPDQALGGPAAGSARENAGRVAAYLRDLHEKEAPLPRHAGKAAPGKVAAAMSEEKRFNRQNFGTNDWCAKLLDAYDRWEIEHGTTLLAQAQSAADRKEPQNKRMSELERDLLFTRAELERARQELGTLRTFVAQTGRLP